jgi:hypothetical protein
VTGAVVTGGCLCGAVRFELEPPLRDVVVCHCSLCRRAGTNAGAYTWVPHAQLRVTAGAAAVYVDANGRERSFCAVCGSSLFWALAGGEGVSVSAGALDGETGLHVISHLHADSAADWERLPRDVPVHAAGSSSALLEARAE